MIILTFIRCSNLFTIGLKFKSEFHVKIYTCHLPLFEENDY